MLDLLSIAYEHQLLRAKQELLNIELDEPEVARMRGLERLLKGSYAGRAGKRVGSRLDSPMPVQFTLAGSFGSGEVHSVSARGVAIVAARCLPNGARTVLRISDHERGFEYVFPGKAIWTRGRVMGVAFDGVPARAPFAAPVSKRWGHSPVRFGEQRSEPMVA